MNGYLVSLAGGVLIGTSAALLLLANGRIAGISGIAGGLIGTPDSDTIWRIAFLLGLMAGPVLFHLLVGRWPEVTLDTSWPLLITGGLLVGFGTRLGSGCTSGHGVCGLSRLSPRSFAAVAVFLTVAILVVFVLRHMVSS